MRHRDDEFLIDLECAEHIQAEDERLTPMHKLAVIFWGSVFCWAVIALVVEKVL